MASLDDGSDDHTSFSRHSVPQSHKLTHPLTHTHTHTQTNTHRHTYPHAHRNSNIEHRAHALVPRRVEDCIELQITGFYRAAYYKAADYRVL